MKKRIGTSLLLLFCIVLITGCSHSDDEMKVQEILDFNTLTIETIETDLKLVNLKVDQNEFDEMYSDFFAAIEIAGTMDVYKDNKLLIENEAIEVEIKGSFTSGFSLKSLGIKFDESYNNSAGKLISTSSLPWHNLQEIKAFRLRNSGNDFKETMMKDLSLTQLAIGAEMDLDLTYGEQVVAFVNNNFFGLMNLRTEANAKGIAKKYQVDKDRITLAKVVFGGEVRKKDGDEQKIDDFFNAIVENNYDYLSLEVDINNFIDYMIFESYIGNEDWPKNNVRIFAIDDGPFRFIMYDLDAVHTQGLEAPPIDFINASFDTLVNNPIGDLFNIFYENENFKNTFDNRYEEILESDLLTSGKYIEIVTSASDKISELMLFQIQKHSFPETLSKWHSHVDSLQVNFKIREDYLKGN